MADNVVNLNRFRKKKAREDKAKQADINRIRHGRTQAEKDRERIECERTTRALAGKRLDKPALLVRRATLADVVPILDIVRRVVPLMRAAGNLQWDDVYPNAEVFTEDVRLERLWLADVDGRIAGFAAITTDQEPEYADVGWDLSETAIVVHRLAVDPELRGLGVAEALLQRAEVVARERGIGVLRIDTNVENEATQRLFPKCGYVLAGEIGLGFRPGLRFRCYEKRLR